MRRPDARGFTLVEVVVAITVLNVMVAVFCRAALTHGEVVARLEDWCVEEPVFYVDPQTSPLARALGWPAELRDTRPASHWRTRTDGPFEIEITSVTRDLAGLISTARVTQRPRGGP